MINLCTAKCVLNASTYLGGDGKISMTLAKLLTDNVLLTSYTL